MDKKVVNKKDGLNGKYAQFKKDGQWYSVLEEEVNEANSDYTMVEVEGQSYLKDQFGDLIGPVEISLEDDDDVKD